MKKLVCVGGLLLSQQLSAHVFRFYCYSGSNVGPNALECYKVSNHLYDNPSRPIWTEYNLTWNNRPQPGVLIATINSVDINCWYEFQSAQLDQYIDSCVAHSLPICFRVKREIQTGSNAIWYFYCKEQTTTQCAQLIYNGRTYTPSDDARVSEDNPNANYCCDFLWACNFDSPRRQEFFVRFDPPEGVEEESGKYKTRFLRCTPTVFTAITYISYSLLDEDAGIPIVLSVYDVAGNLVKNLVNTSGTPGYHEVVWNGTDEKGITVPPGCYFYRLRVGELTLTTKAILLR